MFVYFGGGQGRGSEADSTLTAEPSAGLKLKASEIMTWLHDLSRSWMLNQLSHAGDPGLASYCFNPKL